ncbi:MAG: TRAP transporter small permease [Gemmatimonadetes bacterium]|nr:TRAP transporter small permease [Gemmatimonadota bacterium]
METRASETRTFPDRLAAVNSIVATVLFGGLTVVVLLQVITRFVLHAPLIWSEEVARFLFFWVVLLGAAMSVRSRRHFVIDVTMGRRRRFGPTGRFLFDVVPDLCVLAFSGFLLVQGIAYAEVGLLRVATNSGINMVYVYAAIPAFAALSVVYSVSNLLLDYAAFSSGEAPEPRPPPGAE